MAPKPSGPVYSTVIEEQDGLLICNCRVFGETGKACVHISAVKMQKQFGPVDDYLDLETIRKTRGQPEETTGQRRNPQKTVKGRKYQARSDATVAEELYQFFDALSLSDDPQTSDSSSSPGSGVQDINTTTVVTSNDDVGATKGEPSKDVTTPKKGVGVGRPPKTTPLHPTRTPVQFSKKTGPKAKPHNSLLPPANSSPQKPVNFSPSKKNTQGKSAKMKSKSTKTSNNEPVYDSHELDFFSLEFSRWDDKGYMVRQDELNLVVDILNSINVGITGRALVVPDTYRAHALALQKDIEWTTSDNPPTSRSGETVPEDSLLGRSWAYSQKNTLDQCLIFHHIGPPKNHWLLFKQDYRQSQQTISCYEPLSSHGRRFNAGNLAHFAQFFNPNRSDNTPAVEVFKKYTPINLGLQTDGASCGFWAITFALLLILDINPSSKPNKKVLSQLGLQGLKNIWKQIWTDWVTNPIGLQSNILEPFLSKFDGWVGFTPDQLYIATRPSWIDQHIRPDQVGGVVPQNVNDILQPLLGDKFQGIKDNTARLELGKESLGIDDLQRLNIDCWINDEIINVWRTIMLNRYMNSASNIWIFSSFFFRKLEAWKILKGKAKEDFFLNVRKFYKQINVLQLDYCILPIHRPNESHWILAVFCGPDTNIALYDSWGPTQDKNAQFENWQDAIGADIIKLLIDWYNAEAQAQETQFNWHEWNYFPAGFGNHNMPVQNNTNDCGVFVLIFLYHLLLMDGVNNFELLDDPLCALKKHKQIYCDSSNMRNLREFITKNILQKCTITQVPQLMLEKDLEPTTISHAFETTLSPLTSMPASPTSSHIPDNEEEKMCL